MSRARPIFEGLALALAIGGGWLILSKQIDRVPPGEARHFQMGLAYWPPSDAPDPIVKAGVGTTLENSEVILVQVPWHPERRPAFETSSWLGGVAREHGHDLLIALDWMDPTRDALLGGDWSFADEAVRAHFIEDLSRLSSNLRPERLIVGVEVDLLATRQPEEFRTFVSLYAEVYEEIKKISPETRIGTSFQYESMVMAGMVPQPLDDAGPIRAFGPLLDFIGLSLYPCLTYSTVDEIPDGYLAPLFGVGRPVTITETGWPVGSVQIEQQSAYLDWLASQPPTNPIDLVTWIAMADTGTYEMPDVGPACPPDVTQWRGGLGLWTETVQPKPAARRWATLLRARKFNVAPLEPPKEDQIGPLTSPLY